MLIRIKTILAIAFTVLTWGSAFVAIRAAVQDYSPGSLALFRYLLASLLMGFWFMKLRRFRKPTLKEGFTIAVIGIIGFGIYNVALNYGEVSVTAGIASFIVSQIPVCIAILATLFLREQLSMFGWLGITVSVMGVGIIAISETKEIDFNVGVIALIIAAISGAIYSVGQRFLLKKFDPVELTSYAIWSGTAVMLIYLPDLFHDMMAAPRSATLAAIYLGIVPGALGYAAWSYILMRVPAAKAGTYLYLMPLVAMILGWLCIGDKPTFWSVMGGLIALTGAALINKNKKSKSKPSTDTTSETSDFSINYAQKDNTVLD